MPAGMHERRTSVGSHAFDSHHAYRGSSTSFHIGDGPIDAFSTSQYHPESYQYSERSTPNPSLPPSLWMSPTSTAPSSPNFPEQPFPPLSSLVIPPHLVHDATTGSSGSSSVFDGSSRSTAPTSMGSPLSNRRFSDLFTDELFPSRKPSLNDGRFPSPVVTGSPDLKAAELAVEDVDPEKLAREDPLATQVWKMYAKTKATLPHGQRMENLTWRMMALALKKKKEDEERVKAEERLPEIKQEKLAESIDVTPQLSSSGRPPGSAAEEQEDAERGRSKGKARVKVVGFDGTNQDGVEDTECVPFYSACITLLIILCRNIAKCQWTGEP